MASYRYRAVTASGSQLSGSLEAASHAQAVAGVRRLGATPLELVESASPRAGVARRPSAASRRAVTRTIGELAVLLGAGLSLDRALALAIESIDHPASRAEFVALLKNVKEGMPLARAMALRDGLFPPMAQAMVEAGEANGRLGEALQRLAEALKRADELRTLLGTAMIYPIGLLVIAVGVILLMLLYVVPQFESLFDTAGAELPAASVAVMAASRVLREQGWLLLGLLVLLIVAARALLTRPDLRRGFDRLVLRMPQFGPLILGAQTAQFSRTLAVLIDGGVALPTALAMARRSLTNSHLSAAVAGVASGLKQGGGLTAPLAATGAFPRLAIGFFRTGEETSQLGLMLGRLADVLDADVRVRLQRLIGVLTPAITVVLGVVVAAIIAAIMSAILGFNDLAVQ